MPPHKFIAQNFGDNFHTENTILEGARYLPEILIVGTFNPDTPNANFADFFYGRNYFWTAFKRLANPEYIFVNQRRMPQNGAPWPPLDPTLTEIKGLCQKFRLSFTDLIIEVLHNYDEEIHFLPNDNILLNGQEYNLIQDNAGNGVLGLANLNQIGQVHWNTENIINYLLRTPSIKHIYLTRIPVGIWGIHWHTISNHLQLQDRVFSNILSPSGQGFSNLTPGFIPNANPNNRINSLLHNWIWNGVDNPLMEDLNNPSFGHLDHGWLINCGVDIHQF